MTGMTGMTGMPGDAVVVMAKAPRAGTVKTRLAPAFGHQRCGELQAVLTTTVTTAAVGAAERTYLAYAPADARAEVATLVPPATDLIPQRGRHLGERMSAAAEDAFAAGAGRVVIVGTDTPTLTRHVLSAAFAALDHTDAVIGPALDGGYYLIGMRHAASQLLSIDPQLWGGPAVLTATLAHARAAGLQVRLLPSARDLDDIDDAHALRDDSRVPPEVRRLLRTAAVPS